jgi:endonuclease-8
VGQTVTHIETRGKALLTHFSHNLTLYSHNQLYGVWRVVEAGEQPQTTRVLRVRLQTADKAILLYSASDIEMLTPEQLLTHPFLQRVGPDVLDMRLTASDVKARLLSPHSATGSFPVCCSIRRFWPGWELPAGGNPLGSGAGGAA